jgi:hypothetical protein
MAQRPACIMSTPRRLRKAPLRRGPVRGKDGEVAIVPAWGVFQLTGERRDEPRELLLEALARRGIAADLFPAGEPRLTY